MSHTVKRGDAKTLRWNLGRDLTAVSTARVIISPSPGATPVVDRNGVIDSPATAGIVSLALAAGDYAANKLVAGKEYYVEVETSPGPLTHPDAGLYELLLVVQDLG
jgi:hypothetical protein